MKKEKQNLYYFYIDYLKRKAAKGFAANTCLHKHHILPKHAGGPEEGEIVYCTIRDRARAHDFRYCVYGNSYDKMAYLGLVGRTDEMQKEISKRIVETNRLRQNGPFNPEWQKEMAQRKKSSYYFQTNPEFARSIASTGGKIGGKIMTDKKRSVLKQNGFNVGLNHGRKGGIKHQHPLTKQRLNSIIEWEHESGIVIMTEPQETVQDFVNVLNSYVPNSIKRANHFRVRELLRGVSKSRFGWQIRSELQFDD
jgi:general stress protein YciG